MKKEERRKKKVKVKDENESLRRFSKITKSKRLYTTIYGRIQPYFYSYI